MSDQTTGAGAAGAPDMAGTAGGPAAADPALKAAQVLAAEIQARLALSEGAVKVQRATRLWADVDQAGFIPLFDHLVKQMGFSILCTITGLDLGTDLGFIYHLARDGGMMVNVKTRCPKGTSIRTVTSWFPGADIYERELVDLLGATVEGLPAGQRYPLPDNWPADEHPLLKDWKSPAERAAAAAAAAAPAPGTVPPATGTNAPGAPTTAPGAPGGST